MECSFAGGCQITLTAPGLTGALENPDNYIQVCGEKCQLTDDSDTLVAYCTVPPLITENSVSQFKLAEQKELNVDWTDESGVKVTALTDGELTIDYDSSAGNDPCEITGQAAGDSALFMLSEFRFFIAEVVKSGSTPVL